VVRLRAQEWLASGIHKFKYVPFGPSAVHAQPEPPVSHLVGILINTLVKKSAVWLPLNALFDMLLESAMTACSFQVKPR